MNSRERMIDAAAMHESGALPEVGFVTSRPGLGTEIVVVTDRCVLTRAPYADELILTSLHASETLASIQAEIGWQLQCAPELGSLELKGVA